jgi:predicted TIM-barrel enzyme
MSKFADKLQSLSKSSITPIGFHPSVSELKGPTMLLITGLSGTQVKEAKILADVKADAGLILSEGPSAKVVKQMVEAAGDIPLGVFVKGTSEEEINELTSVGCDFVVFDIKAAAAVLHKEGVGKFLMIEPSLDQGLVRAINSLEVDGVFISSRGGDSFVAVEHLLVCRRFVELLEKPVIMALSSVVTKAELTSLWQVGVDGVIAPPGHSVEALTELKRMINDLPRGARGRRTKAGVVLPRYGGNVTEEEEGDEEEEDI